jgi:hypothetical protein
MQMSVQLINDPAAYARLLRGLEFFRIQELEFIQMFYESPEEIAANLFHLHALNLKSWNARYKEDEKNLYSLESFTKIICNNEVKNPYEKVERVLKAIRFLLYQIEQSEINLTGAEIEALKWLQEYKTRCTEYLLQKYTSFESESWEM